tara:strand:+ start:483 stop:1055 length:573 start_codon:yes stop_codon:yes gene_type:complete
MRYITFIFSIFFLVSCGKPKTVLICGDHVCVNKTEAKQFFEENLTIEVKVLDKNIKEKINLVELNLNDEQSEKRKISIISKRKTNKSLKTLSNKEIANIKKEVKNKKKEKKISKRSPNKLKEKNKILSKTKEKKDIVNPDVNKKMIETVSKRNINVIDVCTVLENCNIDEISKYLLEQGRKKGFPDISKK